MSDRLIEIDALEKAFAGSAKPALTQVSARIRSGIVTGLVGPDGAGKTTLMRLLAGLLIPSSGQIRIRDLAGSKNDDLDESGDASDWDSPEAWRELIGYMPQKFGLYEDLTVQENLDLHADLRGVVGEERMVVFDRLLRFTDLVSFTTRLAGRLSGGMKQKLGLACALLGHPRLLLLDEPGVGVDPISRRELWRMVHDLIREGLTVIWSTAYLDEAELCGEVLLLNEGKLLFAGNPRDLTSRVAERCWQIREPAGSRRRLLARVLRRPEVLDAVIQGHSVRMVLRQDAVLPTLDHLEAGKQARMVRASPRFEDAFIDLLGGGPQAESALIHHVRKQQDGREAVVEAVELTKRFGEFKAADRISFAVRRGEVFGLLGPNGAGKSTVFRMMCGLLTPTSGTAHVMGIDLKGSPSRARQCLGYMAQKFSLYSNLTALQNLKFFSGAYGLRGANQRECVDAMIQVFKLEPYLKATAESLPLGFKQRLALACAVMHEPDLLFLDEPTSGVDPVTRREFWTHINGLVENGVTVVVTTHFMDEAEYCDHIALVFRGQIIATGTPDQLKEQALTPENPDPSMEDAFIELIQKQAKSQDL
ncbi:MAG TPA: ATP-binding cassette domain-containing protein [Candidatus Paceibacterota bacterium]|nr:ATP-binding cassette domain-containing protein [Candidatus Paceibacterota bacterium]